MDRVIQGVVTWTPIMRPISSPASLKQFDCRQERKQTDVGFFLSLVQHSTVA